MLNYYLLLISIEDFEKLILDGNRDFNVIF